MKLKNLLLLIGLTIISSEPIISQHLVNEKQDFVYKSEKEHPKIGRAHV